MIQRKNLFTIRRKIIVPRKYLHKTQLQRYRFRDVNIDRTPMTSPLIGIYGYIHTQNHFRNLQTLEYIKISISKTTKSKYIYYNVLNYKTNYANSDL